MCKIKRKISVMLIIVLLISGLILMNQQKVYAVEGTIQTDISEICFWKEHLILNLGESKNIEYYTIPINANEKNIIWLSSNEKVVKVKDGILTAVGEGKAIVSAKTVKGDIKEECKVIVEEHIELPSKSGVPQDKIWTIKFNRRIMFDEITSKNIYIIDERGEKVDVILEKNDETSISVIPVNNYNEAGDYTLLIKDIQSIDEKELNKTIKMEFRIEGESFIVLDLQ